MRGFFSPIVAVLALSAAFALLGLYLATQTAQTGNVAAMEAQAVADRFWDAQGFLSGALDDAILKEIQNQPCANNGNFHTSICSGINATARDFFAKAATAMSDQIVNVSVANVSARCSSACSVVATGKTSCVVTADAALNVTSTGSSQSKVLSISRDLNITAKGETVQVEIGDRSWSIDCGLGCGSYAYCGADALKSLCASGEECKGAASGRACCAPIPTPVP